jgi:PAS domain S-box-containing protein
MADARVTTSDADLLLRAVETMPTGLIVYGGPEHVVVGANRVARAFFGDRPAIVGIPVREMFPESLGQNLVELLDGVRRTGEPFTAVEWRVQVDDHPDGDERVVTFEVVPVRDADGTISGLACPFTDVTALVRARQQVESRADELRERYAAVQDTVLTLQRSLLPDGLPVLPGKRIAAYYLVAAAEQAAGGAHRVPPRRRRAGHRPRAARRVRRAHPRGAGRHGVRRAGRAGRAGALRLRRSPAAPGRRPGRGDPLPPRARRRPAGRRRTRRHRRHGPARAR